MMKILAVDGIPVPQEKKPESISTDKKIQILKVADEDLEWYPTTPEIMEAMRSRADVEQADIIPNGEKI
jgi:hypothetical protein